ncbi:MAG: hypothetical protein ACM3ZE_16720 [Myxococcales bacterium]
MLARSMTLLSFVSLIGCGPADFDDTDDTVARGSTGGAGAVNNSSPDSEISFGGTSNPSGLSTVGDAPTVGTAGATAPSSVTAGASGQDTPDASANSSLAAPSGLEFVKSDAGRRVLTWQDRSASERGFEIEYRVGPSGDFAQVAVVGADVTAWELPELEPGQHYYRVRATGADGKSEYSAIRGMLIQGASDDPRAPKMPSVSCLVSPPKVTFSWPVADFRVNEGGCPTEANCGYRVYARRSMEAKYNVTSVPMTATSATFSYSLIPTDYYVSAFNRFGDSGLTYVVSVQ